jgi:hypothetical protein
MPPTRSLLHPSEMSEKESLNRAEIAPRAKKCFINASVKRGQFRSIQYFQIVGLCMKSMSAPLIDGVFAKNELAALCLSIVVKVKEWQS